MFEAKLVPHGGHHVDFQRTDRARRSVASSEMRKEMVKSCILKLIYNIAYFS
jgi:hypothetical protein